MISEQLKIAIEKEGQKEVAEESGVERSQIRRFLSGERDLRLRSADKIATALGLELKQKEEHEIS